MIAQRDFLSRATTIQTWLFGNQDNSLTAKPTIGAYAFFWAVLIVYCGCMLALQTNWILSGEMWAEMATNYFANAQNPNLMIKFFSLDAGYLPLPQRLIAALLAFAGFNASAIPYLYTWIAIFLSAMLVGAFCLPVFRPLMRSDTGRFVVALMILAVPDFQTRTFVNFTYFGIFFCAILVALALLPDAEDAPRWAWAAPLLMISKPSLLIVLFAMGVAAFVAKPRLKLVFVACFAAGFAQLWQLAQSEARGMLSEVRLADISVTDKLWAALGYFFGLLGDYTAFTEFVTTLLVLIHGVPSLFSAIASGVTLFAVLAALFLYRRDGSSSLVLVGLSLVFFNCLLNAFSWSAEWNIDFGRLRELVASRRVIGAYFGCVLIIAGLASVLADVASRWMQRWAIAQGIILVGALVAWFSLSGWAVRGITVATEPPLPSTGNSQWQNAASRIDKQNSPLCVPINPMGWFYFHDCDLLAPVPRWSGLTRFGPPFIDSRGVQVRVPSEVKRSRLVAIGIPLKPAATTDRSVAIRALLRTAEGRTVELNGQRTFPDGGGVVLLQGDVGDGLQDVETARITADISVMMLVNGEGDTLPVVMWMGH